MRISKLTQSTPKLIVKGIKETEQLAELMQLGQNLQIKNFDVAKMTSEGVVSLIFALYPEAEDFGRFLQKEKGYEVELALIRELYEIPETDETGERNPLYNKVDGSQGCNSEGQRRMGQILPGDDGPFNLSGQSPMTPGGTRPLNSARFRNNGAPALNTITSSMSSGGEISNNQ